MTDAWDLIADPFYDNGGIDKGMFWHLLQVAEPRRHRLFAGGRRRRGAGRAGRPEQWAMRGLDPIFQVLRTVPPLAWLPISLAAFRDAQPSAIFVIFITSIWPIIINTAVGVRNIPQDYRNVAAVMRLNPVRVLLQDHAARPRRPTSSPACASASACRGSPSSRRRC